MSLHAAVGAGNPTTNASGPSQLHPSFEGPPTDPDNDGYYEELNGNGREDFHDVVVLFEYIDEPAITDYTSVYDFNKNDRLDYDDIVALFSEI